jgi:hypothetical protein
MTMKIKKSLSPLAPDQSWHRAYLVEILQVGLAVGEISFVRKAALAWLAVYPGDLEIQLIHAQALRKTGRPERSFQAADHVCRRDPLCRGAQELRAELGVQLEADHLPVILGECYALNPTHPLFDEAELESQVPSWARKLAEARQSLREGDPEGGQQQLQGMLAEGPPSALAAVTHLEFLMADPETPEIAVRQLAEHYLKTWEDCLVCGLVLGDALNQAGQSEKGVGLLHKAASEDISGQTALRLWGENHTYQNLWPEAPQAHLEVQVPAGIGAALGWNQLPRGIRGAAGAATKGRPQEKIGSPLPPETLRNIQEELGKVAEKIGRETVTRLDGRFPMYVIFSTRKGLENKYGSDTAGIIIEEMKRTCHAVRMKPGWGAITLLADDPHSMAEMGLKPTLPNDPWGLKLALKDLDQELGTKGLMIGALLIVGGPEVVPFHHLPNPVEDVDADVPSDNPYATVDDNYFIPEWPVGRLPGGADSDPGVLLDMLRQITLHHLGDQEEAQNLWKKIIRWLTGLFSRRRKSNQSFGYVAEAWEKASREVFKGLGEQEALVTSPPFGKYSEIPVPVTRMGYFNLHGVEDGGAWYGQKDFKNGSAGPNYPIALRPEDINQYEDAPLFVLTEACYGAHLKGRGVEDSIPLKYMTRGTHAVIGSTVTAYGSVAAPLIAADLLAESFWKQIQDGSTVGVALQKAKIRLARIMNERQGYLDGEDQKTLISFILIGDPLTNPITAKRAEPKSVWRPKRTEEQVPTVCDRMSVTKEIPTETVRHVKHIVKRYLPGMEDAEMVMTTEKETCAGEGHECATARFGEPVHTKSLPERKVVTLSKEYAIPQNGSETVHRHYARVTFDQQGKMVKLAVSR